MLVHRIVKFAAELSECAELAEFDRNFLQSVALLFSKLPHSQELTSEQIQWLRQNFEKRWGIIVDTINDYTFERNASNAPWIKLSRDLAVELKLSYLQILIPSATNLTDSVLLTPHADCSELRAFYVGSDGTTLHRVRGLFELLQQKNPFSTFKTSSQSKPELRHLSLVELFRIRSKKGDDLQFDFSEKIYKNFWDYLVREIMPNWHTQGECPKDMLSSLVDIIDCYYLADSPESFRKKILELMGFLQAYSVDDVNNLYGQVIQVNGQDMYLVEILLDCLYGNRTELDEKLRGIATWLTTIDRSLVAKSTVLQDLYSSLHLGKGFNSEQLKLNLSALNDGGSPVVRHHLDSLLAQLGKKAEIDAKIIEELREVYKLRWQLICGSKRDYTRLQDDINAPWIELAQRLCSAGYIEANYYAFLMPTLTHHTDSVRQVCLTNYPLSHYVLSEDNTQLILLDNSAARFKDAQTFYKCNEVVPQQFTQIEMNRIAYANKRFHRYIEFIQQQWQWDRKIEPPISIATIHALRQLIEGSLYPEGLLLAHDYTPAHMTAAEKAYEIFFKFLHDLPADELQRLKSQRIYFNKQMLTVEQVLFKISKQECIAVYGQFLLQLVIDYAPDIHFSPAIESRESRESRSRRMLEKKVVDKLAERPGEKLGERFGETLGEEVRTNSRKKVLREQEIITSSEALRRIEIVFTSLMIHKFQYIPMTSYPLSFREYTNHVPSEVKVIYDLIAPVIATGDTKDICHIYSRMIELVVKPLVANKGFSTWLSRYNDTRLWLNSIADESLFQQKDNLFDPELLLAKLSQLVKRIPSWGGILHPFLDRLVQVFIQASNPEDMKVRVNIHFMEILRGLNKVQQEELFNLLQLPIEAPQLDFRKRCVDFFIHRLALLGTGASGSHSPSFFRGKRSESARSYRDIRKTLQEDISETVGLTELIDTLQSRLSNIISPEKTTPHTCRMAAYWQTITNRPLPTLSARDDLRVSPQYATLAY